MLYLKLFAVLVALPFSDGAVLTDVKCEYQPGSQFCKHLLAAFHQNRETLLRMPLSKFNHASNRLRNANAGINEALLRLSENRTHELLHPLSLALDSESSAVAGVPRECTNSVTEPKCAKILQGLLDASKYLVEAIIEVTDEEKKNGIVKLYTEFGKEKNQTKNFPGFLSGVLEVLKPDK